jgi:glycosyltransferase involved in cell wall biosynthesis
MSLARARRFLIDGTMAKGGGGFTYLVNILPELCEQSPRDQFRLLVRSERVAASIAPRSNLSIDLLPAASWMQRMRFTYLELPRIAKEWGTDLYFSAGETAPLRAPFPMIASFRNPVPYAPDPSCTWKQRARLAMLREISRLSARACDRIMFVSEDSSRWIGDLLEVPAERRAVVHHGIDARAWARPEVDIEAGHRTNNYILSVSSVYPHKNYVRLIDAYAALGRRHENLPDLVIIGDVQHPDYLAQMERARTAAGDLAEQIHILGEVPYAEIKQYYAGADLFVFPSYLETFGHPLLEAMASDVPTVAADIPCFREIAGDAAFYADPHKTDALADAIESALFSPRARRMLLKRGRECVRQFSWSASAGRLLSLFDEVLSERAAV